MDKASDNTIKKNSMTKPVDINKLPTIPILVYLVKNVFIDLWVEKLRRLLPVETHRGCPYTCSFL